MPTRRTEAPAPHHAPGGRQPDSTAVSGTATGLLLVEPAAFAFNAQTAATNRFQAPAKLAPETIAAQARSEFSALVTALRGAAIPLARLQALPYATTCIQCQREAEKNGEVVGGASLSRIFDGGLADTEVSAGDLEIDVS